jgi:hypothetical protein
MTSTTSGRRANRKPRSLPDAGPQFGADRADGGDRRGHPRGQVLAVAHDEDAVPEGVDTLFFS